MKLQLISDNTSTGTIDFSIYIKVLLYLMVVSNCATNYVIFVRKAIVCKFLIIKLMIYFTMGILNQKFTFKTGIF